MKPACDAFLLALRKPEAMADFDPATWDRVIRHARAAGLIGRLGVLATPYSDRLLPPVRRNLETAVELAQQQQRAVLWELQQLSRALAHTPGPVLLLKGAAYAAATLAPAAGRIYSDVDLLVPRAQLAETESNLRLAGWVSMAHDAYDLRYYREWMHELPPMRHIHRKTWLDLHHNILPETARRQTRPDLILAAAQPLAAYPRLSIPQPVDLVLHSATHLFHEGEWQQGLRGLVDLDALLRSFSVEPGFWPDLLARAALLNLGRPLHYALRYTHQVLHTPVPEEVMAACPERPLPGTNLFLDALFLPALAVAHRECSHGLSSLAAFILYIRSHWLRMPAHLLIPHLLRKSFRSANPDSK